MVETRAEERARASLEGLSVGDGFGERFMRAGPVAATLVETRSAPPPPWPWTDDTAMALAIVEVLSRRGTVDQDELARAFVDRWAREPDRGYGGGAFRLLGDVARGEPWREAARQLFDGGSMGNGAAMRVAPLGAFFAADGWQRVVDEAARSAEVTHAHDEGVAGAVAVAVAAAWAAGDRASPLFEIALDLTPPGETRARIEQAARLPLETAPARAGAALGNGMTVLAQDTVAFCLWCVARHPASYEDALWATIAAFGDCDTTCAIVGGIVAAAVGADGVPRAWRESREPLA